MNNYGAQIYTGFTGLMYAIISDNVQAFELLADAEFDVCLETEQVLRARGQFWLLMKGFSALHLAALAGNQQFFNHLQQMAQQRGPPGECAQTPSELALVAGREIADAQFLRDFHRCDQLLRLAVQHGRVGQIRKMVALGRQRALKRQYYAQVFCCFRFRDDELTVLDLIAETDSKTVKNLVRQAIADALTEMITENTLSEHEPLLERFYRVEGVCAQITSEYKEYTAPRVLADEAAARAAFCRISAEALL